MDEVARTGGENTGPDLGDSGERGSDTGEGRGDLVLAVGSKAERQDQGGGVQLNLRVDVLEEEGRVAWERGPGGLGQPIAVESGGSDRDGGALEGVSLLARMWTKEPPIWQRAPELSKRDQENW